MIDMYPETRRFDRILAMLDRAAELRMRREEVALDAERNAARPSVILGIDLDEAYDAATDRTTWLASYGGLHCLGATPDEAFVAFDEAWVRGV